MDAQANGIGLNKREVSALVAFSSSDDGDPNRYGVFFRIKGDRVYARSTDGRRSVEADGCANEEHPDGEWMVDKRFLIKATRVLSGNGKVRLAFEGASLRRAVGEEGEYLHDEDAAIAQHEFPDLGDALKVPTGRKLTAHLSVGDADTMTALGKVSKAADRPLTLRVPASPDVPSIWEVESTDTNTKWTISLAPYALPKKKTKAPKKGQAKQPELDLEPSEPGRAPPGKPAPKASKAAAKKAPAKKPSDKK